MKNKVLMVEVKLGGGRVRIMLMDDEFADLNPVMIRVYLIDLFVFSI